MSTNPVNQMTNTPICHEYQARGLYEEVRLLPHRIQRADASPNEGRIAGFVFQKLNYDLQQVQRLPKETLAAITIHVITAWPAAWRKALQERFASAPLPSGSKEEDGKIVDMSFGRFLQLTPMQLDMKMSQIHPRMMSLLTHQQAEGIDVSRLSQEKLVEFVSKRMLPREEVKARLSRLHSYQIDQLKILIPSMCELITEKQLV